MIYAGELLERLRQGTAVWNHWRHEHPNTLPYFRGVDLRRADLGGANLRGADLQEADLREANLSRAILWKATLSRADMRHAALTSANLRQADLSRAMPALADFRGADLSHASLQRASLLLADLSAAILHGANLHQADLFKARLCKAELYAATLSEADLRQADLSGAMLTGAILDQTNLREARLYEADLTRACLIQTNLEKAALVHCAVHGMAAWGGQLTAAQQAHLRITPPEELPITVDDLRLAQLVALWLDTGTLHRVLGTGSARVVLVLGDFSLKYQEVWGAVRDALQHHDYVPVWCDRLAAERQDAADLLSRLALLARFVLVDLSHAASPLQGLRALMPTLQRTRTLPVQPLWQETSITATTAGLGQEMPEETSSWLLEGRPYASPEHLRAILDQEVIAAAAAKVKALE